MIKREVVVFIICLITAFVWWVIHQLNQTYLRQYNLNAVIVKVPKVYEQDSIHIPLKIKVKASGLKIILLENYYTEKIYISFRELKKINKKGLFFIDAHTISENKSFPVKVKIQEVTPDTIRINFKNKKKK